MELLYKDDKVKVIRIDDNLIINYHQSHTITIKENDKQAIDNEVIRMIKIRDEDGKKYFIQKNIGRIIGVSRQMVNRRWQVYKKEGLLSLLSGNWERSKITPAVLNRITELCVENPFLSAKEIKEILESEGLCEKIAESTIYIAQMELDGRKMIELMREKSSRKTPGVFLESGYLINKLFEIIGKLFAKIPSELQEGVRDEKRLFNHLRLYFKKANIHGKGPGEVDKYQPRKKLDRDRRRNIGFLKRLLTGISLYKKCPDCHSGNVRFHLKRPRYFMNSKGKKIQSYSTVYRCLNPECKTKYFTQPPKGVELYARVNTEVKEMALRWSFHLRASLSRVRDELAENGINVSLTTVLRWIKKAGEESVEMLMLSGHKDKEEPLCIDEKWIKIRNKWCYVFTAIGAKTSDLVSLDLFYHKDKDAMRTFLLWIKLLGYRPRIIVTDLLMGYESIVKEVFPDCCYHQCVLHAERDAKRIVRLYLKEDEDEVWKKTLTKHIRKLFSSKKGNQVKKRYSKIFQLKENVPDSVLPLFDFLKKYYPKLYQSVIIKDIPKTTNPVERLIGEFEEKYQQTKGFTSFYYAKWFIKAFQVYYGLRKITFGPLKGKNRLELKGNPIGKLKFTEYLTPTQT